MGMRAQGCVRYPSPAHPLGSIPVGLHAPTMDFTKDQIKLAKAFAILCMFAHHLYALPYRIYQESELISVLGTSDIMVERYIGEFGNVCGGMFMFLSGLGLGLRNKAFNLKSLVGRLSGFYSIFLANFILLIGASLYLAPPLSEATLGWKGIQLDLPNFLMNLLLIKPTYSMEWWYTRLYVAAILLVWPTCEFFARRGLVKPLFMGSALGFAFSILIAGPDGFLYHQFIFVTGFLAGRYRQSSYSKLLSLPLQGSPREVMWTCVSLIAIAFVSKNYFGQAWEVLLAPVLCVSMMGAITWEPLRKVFLCLGDHSANMWLNHTFLIYYWFHKPFYGLKYTPLLFLLLILGSFAISCLTQPLVRLLRAGSIKLMAKFFPEPSHSSTSGLGR